MFEVDTRGNVVVVDLMYPRNGKEDTVQVGLCDVRAADDVQVSYDFERDGWVIKQQNDADEWVESAFVQAWAKQTPVDAADAEQGGMTT